MIERVKDEEERQSIRVRVSWRQGVSVVLGILDSDTMRRQGESVVVDLEFWREER